MHMRTTKTNQKQKVRGGMPASSNGDPDGSCSVVAAATASDQYHPLAFTVLWSPLPPITCIFPFIGHMGITTSRGVACDFQGPYSVGDRDRMAFGRPTRALRFDVSSLPGGAEQWDKAVVDANGEYRTRMHNIFCDNCHSHVAYALNSMNMRAFGFNSWDMIKLCFLVFFRGRFLSWGGFLSQFLPFGAFVLVVVLLKTL